MKFIQEINEAVEDVEERLDLQNKSSRELLAVVKKLYANDKKET
jgi:hypothetical protein